MDVQLSWDLFVIVFFALVITYSYIVGKHNAVKIIVAAYIAILAGQGIGNIFQRFSAESEPILSVLGLSLDITVLGGTKLLIFVITMILLAVKGGLEISYSRESSSSTDIALIGVFGFATAALLLSTLITFVTDAPLLDPQLVEAAQLSPIIQESKLMQAMIFYQDLWFALPAMLLIGVGFISNE